MTIYVCGINFYPELIGIGVYNTEVCEYLRDAGHKVTVFTGFPYYPSWSVEKEYRGKLFTAEDYQGIKLRRSYLYVPHRITSKSRILHEFSFTISSFFNLLFSKKPEVMIVISPPLGLGLAAYIISRIRKIPFIFHIQDLQPDAAVKLGMIKNKKLICLLYRMEKFIYKRAYLVSVIGLGMQERVISKGIEKEKVILSPNWVDTDFIRPLPKQNRFRERFKLDDKFIVLYAGNIGVKQGLETILSTASLISDIKEILFLIVGDGVRREFLAKEAKRLNLTNVKFLSPQPKEILPEMLSAADISLVIQRMMVTDFALPSKTLGILASGKAMVACASGESELSKLAKEVNCAVVVEPENPEELKDSILNLYDDKDKRDVLGRNGREYACTHLLKDKILSKFEKSLREMSQCFRKFLVLFL